MRGILAAALLLPLAPASAQTGDSKSTLIALFEQHDCTIGSEVDDAIFEAAGLSEEVVERLAEEMIVSGEIVMDNETMTAVLVTGSLCEKMQAAYPPPPGEDERKATIIRVFEENGCTLTEDEADVLMPQAGLIESRDSGLLIDMIEADAITLSEDRSTATLVTGEVCGK